MEKDLEKDNLREKVRTGFGIIRMLKEHGVKRIFGVPDGHILELYDALSKTEGIEHVLVNDERTAAFAADAYARVTGMLTVCIAGAAGSMNFPIALSEAKGSGSPVLAIIGTVKSKHLLRNIPHDIKIEEALNPLTKWAAIVINAENTPRFVSYAIRQAINGKPGPVALVFPEDVLTNEELKLKDFMPIAGGACSINSCRPAPTIGEISVAAKMIKNSEQPVIFSGGRAVLSGAFSEIEKLSRMLLIPVFSTISGKGIMVPSDDEKNMYFGTIGLFGEAPNHTFLKNKADLIIVIGNRLTEDDTAYFKFPPQRKQMIQIDIDPAQIGLNYQAWGIVGDPKASLIELIKAISSNGFLNGDQNEEILTKRKENLTWLRKEHNYYREKDNERWMNTEPIKPERVLKALSENMDENDYLVTDASSSSRWIGPYFPVKSLGRKIITPRGVGPTGFGLGALIGTSIAIKDIYSEGNAPRVVLISGDGGLMNGGLSDLETIQKLELDCTIIVLNNSSLGFVKFGQTFLYKKRYYETDRPTTDFSKIINAFGGYGVTIDKLKDLDEAIRTAINSRGLNLVDVLVDKEDLLPPNFYL